MNQVISILDSYAYRTLVWDIFVERVRAPKQGPRRWKSRCGETPVSRPAVIASEAVPRRLRNLQGIASSLRSSQ
jgi:hypothetical protein